MGVLKAIKNIRAAEDFRLMIITQNLAIEKENSVFALPPQFFWSSTNNKLKNSLAASEFASNIV